MFVLIEWDEEETLLVVQGSIIIAGECEVGSFCWVKTSEGRYRGNSVGKSIIYSTNINLHMNHYLPIQVQKKKWRG